MRPSARSSLPDGPLATAETINVLAQLASGDHGAHAEDVRNLAVKIIAKVPGRDYRGEVAAILAWVQATITYRHDPVGQERVAVPMVTVADRAGDCDDLSLLTAALLGAVGTPTRFATGGMTRAGWSHVWLEAQVGDGWVALDPCDPERRPPGWFAAFPHIHRWPVNSTDGFDPAAELREAQRTAGGSMRPDPAMSGLFDFWSSKPEFTSFSTDPALAPLPDPQQWWTYNDGNPPTAGDSVPHWSDAPQAVRGAWLKAMLKINTKDTAAKEATLEKLDTAVRVTEGVATLGVSEVIRAWDSLVADCNTYRSKRSTVLTHATELESAGDAAAAKQLRDAVATGDTAISEKLGILRPFLASEAGLDQPTPGLGFLPAPLAALATPAALILIALVATAVAFALAQVAHVIDSITTAVGGGPWLLWLALGVGGFYGWKKYKAWKGQQRGGRKVRSNPGRRRRRGRNRRKARTNPAWRAPRFAH